MPPWASENRAGIAEAARRAVHDLRDQSERAHRAPADAGSEQQLGKIDRRALGRGGEIAVQPPQMNVFGARTS